MAKIESVKAREILDSRGYPTIEAEIHVKSGIVGWAKVPSVEPASKYEATQLRDQDTERYFGLGVQKAVHQINNDIHAAILGKDTSEQSKLDRLLIELDGTPNKSRLGANAVLAVSLAIAQAEAASQGLPLYLYLKQLFPTKKNILPLPHLNLINGGKHASTGLSIQEYHVLPVGLPSFSEALRAGVEIHFALKKLLVATGYQVGVGDEGGFVPAFKESEKAFTFLVRAIEAAGYEPGGNVFLGIDAAASQFYEEERNQYRLDGVPISPDDLASIYRTWCERYPIISIEDPFSEDAWPSWTEFMKKNGAHVQIVGDEIYATNVKRIKKGIAQGATNAVTIKPTQIGTLTETLQSVLVAQEANQNIIVSHRTGETEDYYIADLAVALGAGQIKAGAPMRSERTAKYNRLLTIEDVCEATMAKPLQDFLGEK